MRKRVYIVMLLGKVNLNVYFLYDWHIIYQLKDTRFY